MNISRTLKTLALGGAIALISACGGGSDDDKDVTPEGSALTDVWFADNDGYFPLDKLKPDGTFYTGSESDFGPTNPAFTSQDKRNSRWAIDASASLSGGGALTYSMKVEGVNAPESAVNSLTSNLRINTQTGLITQYCEGFPACFDNQTTSEERFLITVEASVVGGKGKLERSFVLRVRSNR
jgi:hypothetical protein